jgi:hypothetical protein
MTSPELDNLVRIGKLKRESGSDEEVVGLLQSAEDRLNDAGRADLSYSSRFLRGRCKNARESFHTKAPTSRRNGISMKLQKRLTASNTPGGVTARYRKNPTPQGLSRGPSHADFSSCDSVEECSGSDEKFRTARRDEFGHGRVFVPSQAELVSTGLRIVPTAFHDVHAETSTGHAARARRSPLVPYRVSTTLAMTTPAAGMKFLDDNHRNWRLGGILGGTGSSAPAECCSLSRTYAICSRVLVPPILA